MNLREEVRAGATVLKQAGVTEYETDAWLLLSYVTGLTRAQYYLREKEELSKAQKQMYDSIIKRRALRIPLQYLTGQQEFMGLSFQVTEQVLIPRQDTELLVQKVLEAVRIKAKSQEEVALLELCVGSGCVLLSVLYYAGELADKLQAAGSDISGEALQIAKQNEKKLAGEVPGVQWICSDLFEKIQGTYDIIAANPPYISGEELEGLEPEVRCHEPGLALDGGQDGLDFYRRIAQEAKGYLRKMGVLLLEIGCGQGALVKALLEEKGFSKVEVLQDLAGLDRVVVAQAGERNERGCLTD